MTTYFLKPRIPGGTWLAILLLIAGTIAVAISFISAPSMVLRVVGAIAAIGGLALLIMTVVAMQRRRVWVTLDDDTFTVEGPRGEYSGAWADITDVAVSRRTAKIALWLGPDRRIIIAHPAQTMDDEFMRLREGIRRHVEETV
ncbi:MAG: hypothetical protein LBV00_04735 [Propionibacteriaceae bacterium]|jgi:membrane-bound ClpP family serine protease|nr:hypothetical protein [Propionibacteriaceae bacterium]